MADVMNILEIILKRIATIA
ncbi:Protein of unknown function [Bacillus wiedmannii]|nr:Protein of unknown function [Bacillus wiedmannii]